MINKNDVGAAHQLGQDPNIPTHPNTDSRELKEAIEALVNNYSHKEYRVDSLVALCLTYTANKQRELLEWVEQEVIGPDLPLIPHGITGQPSDAVIAMNYEFDRQREQLKNEKELL